MYVVKGVARVSWRIVDVGLQGCNKRKTRPLTRSAHVGLQGCTKHKGVCGGLQWYIVRMMEGVGVGLQGCSTRKVGCLGCGFARGQQKAKKEKTACIGW